MNKIKNCDRFNLLYVSDFESCETIKLIEQGLQKDTSPKYETLLQGNEFIIEDCFGLSKGIQIAQSTKPDIIVAEFNNDPIDKIEKLALDIKSAAGRHCPAIFLVLSSDPGIETREKLLIIGYNEYFIQPFPIIEFIFKAKVHINNKHFTKMDAWRKTKLDKALQDIDKFENELASVKEELFDERDVLNNSLKQINLMTKERDKLKKDIQHADNELTGNLEGFTKLLCSMIESRVEENRGHSFRVAEISLFVAEEMKLSALEKDQLGKAAMLHEMGKLLISEAILNKKKDELKDNEKGFFRHYPEKGARLLEKCSGFDKIADIVKYQNENVDGSGSPEGLKRKLIPLQSRILAGANLFDELRCRKDISSLDDLFEKLEEKIGSRLDPKVVNCLEKYAVTRLGSDFEKVKGIGIHQLAKGMRLGTALFTSGGTKLFSANTLLDNENIEKIIKYNKEYPVDETI
ncbi:MAG: HD domain-containing protein, partial [Desulfobacteraceae bacterium]|nr:HD domain-containing protein [Desulfobacteraceae bacterium]